VTEESIEFLAKIPKGSFGSVGRYPRSECELFASKRIPSGELFLIRHPEGMARLYFPAERMADAERVREELTEQTIDPVLLVQEFASLAAAPGEDEDDDY
jgi:hypothetical protein